MTDATTTTTDTTTTAAPAPTDATAAPVDTAAATPAETTSSTIDATTTTSAPAPTDTAAAPAPSDTTAAAPAAETAPAETTAPATETASPAPAADTTAPAATTDASAAPATTDAAAAPAQTEAPAPAPTFVEKVVTAVENEVTSIVDKVTSFFHPSLTYSPEFKARLEDVEDNGNMAQKELVRIMTDYLVHMAPKKPITTDAGAKQQYNLWMAIKNITSVVTRDQFDAAWSLLLAYFKEFGNGALSELYVHRFNDAWAWDPKELTMLNVSINLLKRTIEVETKNIPLLKQIDLEKTLATGFSDEARQRIMNFYAKYM